MNFEQILSFTQSFIAYLKSGKQEVPPQLYQQRIITCFKCEKRTKDWRCSECGCSLELKAKWATEECPLGKWQKIELPIIKNQLSINSSCGCQSPSTEIHQE